MRFSLIIFGFAMQIHCTSKPSANQNSGNTKKNSTPATGYIVGSKNLNQQIEVPGSIEAYEEVELHPDVSGRVTHIYFREGTYVAAGTALLRVYDADLQAQYRKLEIQLKTAKKTVERNAMLLKVEGLSQQDYDLSVLAVNTIRADMDIIKTSIRRTILYAPFSGKLGITNITTGAYLTPQSIVTTLKRTNPLQLSFALPEQYGNLLKEGELINFTVEGTGTIYGAIVSAKENFVDAATRTLRMIATIDHPDGYLIIGKFADVQISFGKTNLALMVPTQCIIPQARFKKVVAVQKGIAKMLTVTTGIRDSSFVEITSGLQTGDTILVTGLLTTKEGTPVKLNSIINQ
jgi:membrane fusion protein (multidrug efflux system)